MILTGNEIINQLQKHTIEIVPFHLDQINPNSYNYCLGEKILVQNWLEEFEEEIIPERGYILEPGKVYLASTYEKLGSNKYAMSLIGRSSIGRLGLFLQISANLGHTGSAHNWTLELVATKKIRIYPKMIIGQISFWNNDGIPNLYLERYASHNVPKISILEEGK